jgi:hypothetical protein
MPGTYAVCIAWNGEPAEKAWLELRDDEFLIKGELAKDRVVRSSEVRSIWRARDGQRVLGRETLMVEFASGSRLSVGFMGLGDMTEVMAALREPAGIASASVV